MLKERRFDLDWIRVLVFALLILYHVGMLFVPWSFHIKNNEIGEIMQYPMVFVNQWRLPILFVVSGMGTRFALSYRSGGQFIKERNIRLLIPLAFGMLVVVPPQVYLERLIQGLDYSSFFDFYPHYFNGTYPTGNFSWHHLWFLPYLLVYSILLTPLLLYLRKNSESPLMRSFGKIKKAPYLLFLLTIPLIFIEYKLKPIFPLTRNLISDWYGFLHYMLFFLYGFLFISVKDEFWEAVKKMRWVTLLLGLLAFPLLLWSYQTNPPYMYESIIRIINMWSWILAIMGLGAMYLNKRSTALAYCNEAVYPFYILHQTVMMILAFHFVNLEMAIGLKFLILAILTFLICWMLYEFVIKRLSVTRILFGMKPKL